MVNFHALCHWASRLSFDQIPPRILAGAKARTLLIGERQGYQNSSVLWASSHLGGQFDGALEL